MSHKLDILKKYWRKKKKINESYFKNISKIRGISFIENPIHSKSNNWINLISIDKKKYKKSLKQLIKIFTYNKIQVRPIWFLNHLQKSYRNYQNYKIINAKQLLSTTLCLPSSASLQSSEIKKIIDILKKYQK